MKNSLFKKKLSYIPFEEKIFLEIILFLEKRIVKNDHWNNFLLVFRFTLISISPCGFFRYFSKLKNELPILYVIKKFLFI